MDLEELKLITEAIAQLGDTGATAFTWWLIANHGGGFILGMAVILGIGGLINKYINAFASQDIGIRFARSARAKLIVSRSYPSYVDEEDGRPCESYFDEEDARRCERRIDELLLAEAKLTEALLRANDLQSLKVDKSEKD